MKNTYTFKSNQIFFDKEKSGLKNNTFRKIDLSDERFLELIAHNELGYNHLYIKIIDADNISRSFEREIKDIIIYEGYMIITWAEEVTTKEAQK